jgi:hypothetical protein
MAIREFEFTLTGIMPLLMHADDIDAADTLSQWRKDPANKNRSQAGDDRSPAFTWHSYVYSDSKNIVMPSENIMVALRQAGSQMILKKQKTFKEISQSGLLITTEFCDFSIDGKPIPMSLLHRIKDMPFAEQAKEAEKNGFRLFCKRAKIGTSKHIRVRPRFDNWSVYGRIQVIAPEISDEHLRQLFDLAGRVGVCDWRPGCKTPGPFGMFSAKVD